jgi:hypothetical protein
MQQTIAAHHHPAVRPAYDGVSTLPRVLNWAGVRSRLSERPASVELSPAFYELKLGQSYARQLAALGMQPQHASAKIAASEEGFSATLSFRSEDRVVEDRWDVAVDANGVIRDCRSDSHAELWHFEAAGFSRFFEALLAAL